MKRLQLAFLVAATATLLLTGCGGASTPMPTPTASSSSSSSPLPTPEPTTTAAPDEADAEPALIPVRIAAGCNDLATPAVREKVAGVADADIARVTHPLANGSAAELQAGVLTCQWSGPVIAAESSVEIEIKVLPDAAAEFAEFAPVALGSEVLGTLGAGSLINCFDAEGARSCYLHFLDGVNWVDAHFIGVTPAPATDAIAAATEFAGEISDALAAAGPLGAPYAVPAGALAAWTSCNVLDDLGAFRSAVASPSLTSPEGEFTGAGTLFAEAWQRVEFKSCVWRQIDPYTSPVGEIRMASVSILPGAEWAWASLRETDISRGGNPVTVAGADDATLNCPSADDCTLHALVQGSYVNVYLSVEQYRGGAEALAVTAAEFAISRL